VASGPTPRDGGPAEGVGPAAQAGSTLRAEARLVELDPALEWLAIDQLRFAEIAQRQLIAIVQRAVLAVVILDQDPAGARIAYIEHQIDVDRRMNAVVLVAQQRDARNLDELIQQARNVR